MLSQDTEVGRGVLFSDDDSLPLNSRITYEIFNDTLEFLVPKCQAFEADHKGLKASAIHCSKFCPILIILNLHFQFQKLVSIIIIPRFGFNIYLQI